MKVFLGVVIVFLILVLLGVAGFFAVVYSGIFNVAATVRDPPFVEWIASTTSDNSIRAHAKGIPVPANLSEPTVVTKGLPHYAEMCVTCHGAPGVAPSDIGKGLNPLPPDLVESAGELTPAEVYWVVTNGIKMTGMPAFKSTHNDELRWAITAVVEQLPSLTPEKYKEMVKAAGPMREEEPGAATEKGQ